MPGRILIIDSVATNRIVMNVKMRAAQFDVDSCANHIEATQLIARNMPDLILINLCDPTGDLHGFCQGLRDAPETHNIAIIAIGIADTSQARFAAVDAGADDVMPRPVNDALLLARIRSLLRVRSVHQELLLRDGTSRALGFEEPHHLFQAPANVALLSTPPRPDRSLLAALSAGLSQTVRCLDAESALQGAPMIPTPDLFVIDAQNITGAGTGFFGLVSDLRARAQTRRSAQMVVVPHTAPDIAAMFLDLGADDVIPDNAGAAEIAMRARVLVQRKQTQDHLRNTLRDGLQAAVTDPLTGLFNRRYVDTQLARMAQHAQISGETLAVMIVDIDHFKTINDTYGHAAGDMVLRQLAKRMRDTAHTADLIARIGGEEFLIALPTVTSRQARDIADKIRRIASSEPYDIGEAHAPLRVTVSVGVALTPLSKGAFGGPETMCQQADAALYAAKRAGRDQVAISNSII